MELLSHILVRISSKEIYYQMHDDAALYMEVAEALRQADNEHETGVSNFVLFTVPGYPPMAAVKNWKGGLYACNADLLADLIIDKRNSAKREENAKPA